MKIITIILISLLTSSCSYCQNNSSQNIPISTKWTLDAAGPVGRTTIPSIFYIQNLKENIKGTGFLLKTGEFITCAHVVKNANYHEIVCYSSYNEPLYLTKIIKDTARDLAILIPNRIIHGGLTLGSEDSIQVGNALSTWGFPLGYNGPSPLLSVGYLAGFLDHQVDTTSKKFIKHLVVNGAFNPGNSGGPLFMVNNDKVIGVVVSKHAPITDFQLSALKALSDNISGVNFTAKYSDGSTKTFVESQVVADLLFYFRDLTQVMIGEAISVSVLKEFLKENRIKY